jgi:hypothetical protein
MTNPPRLTMLPPRVDTVANRLAPGRPRPPQCHHHPLAAAPPRHPPGPSELQTAKGNSRMDTRTLNPAYFGQGVTLADLEKLTLSVADLDRLTLGHADLAGLAPTLRTCCEPAWTGARAGSSVATVADPPGDNQLQSKKGKWTARVPKLSFLHIKILTSSIGKERPRAQLPLSRNRAMRP